MSLDKPCSLVRRVNLGEVLCAWAGIGAYSPPRITRIERRRDTFLRAGPSCEQDVTLYEVFILTHYIPDLLQLAKSVGESTTDSPIFFLARLEPLGCKPSGSRLGRYLKSCMYNSIVDTLCKTAALLSRSFGGV
jgi:hypothetical protein